jgi:hypothetical protein
MSVERYRLFNRDGSQEGEAHCAAMVGIGDAIRSTDGRLLRVVDVVPTFADEADKYVGLLMVEAA